MGEFDNEKPRKFVDQIVEKEKIAAMFSLFYVLWKHMFSKMEFHVFILGIEKAGKTVSLVPFGQLVLSPYLKFKILSPVDISIVFQK